jgi:hypothetical protein
VHLFSKSSATKIDFYLNNEASYWHGLSNKTDQKNQMHMASEKTKQFSEVGGHLLSEPTVYNNTFFSSQTSPLPHYERSQIIARTMWNYHLNATAPWHIWNHGIHWCKQINNRQDCAML